MDLHQEYGQLERKREHRLSVLGWLIFATLALMLAASQLNCSPLSAQRAACSAVGVTLTAASERIVDAMADDYVRSEDDAEVDDRWAPTLAAYETATVAQNAWADALDAGQEFPVESVRGVYCTAREALVEVVAMPDWPMGGCQ